jgi:hypothetical protein
MAVQWTTAHIDNIHKLNFYANPAVIHFIYSQKTLRVQAFIKRNA